MSILAVAALRNRILGVLIRNARDQARVSRRECAAVLGVTANRFAAYENGEKAISLPEIELLSRFLEVPYTTFQNRDSLNDSSEIAKLPNPELYLTIRNRITGGKLLQLRQASEQTQQDVASVLGCSKSVISDYEHGRKPIPLADLEQLAQAYNVSMDVFRDRDTEIGLWHTAMEQFEQFEQLSEDVREFVLKPSNQHYLELAMRLEKLPVGALRTIAESLLEITY